MRSLTCPRRTVTSADSPARSGTSGGGLTQAMRTGTRCTTFTKLPEALSGGSSEKLRAGAAGEALDPALELAAGIRVDRDLGASARAACGRPASP